MQSKYEAICEELDTVAISYFEKLNDYTQTWKETASQFQQGYLDLAHAKYTMGTHRVSRYFYDERMKANLQVEIDTGDDRIKIKHIPVTSQSPKKEKQQHQEEEGLRRRTNIHAPEKKKNSEWVAAVAAEDSVNRTQASDSACDDKDEIELDEKKNTKKIKKNGDPLYWFGLFVSPSLRTSQEHFKSATEQLIHQVNRINELKSLEQRYDQLLEEKLAFKLEETSIGQQQQQQKEDVSA